MLIVLTHMIANITVSYYSQITSSLDLMSLPCPSCHEHGMHVFAYYMRYVKNPGCADKTKIRILRVRCIHCGATHAVLPSSIVPYSQITMKDTVAIIEAQSKEDAQMILDNNIHISAEDFRLTKLRFQNFWKSRILNIKASLGNDSFFSECISVFKMQFMQIPLTICGSYSCHHLIQGELFAA